MFVVLNANAPSDQVDVVCSTIRDMGYQPHVATDTNRTTVCITGDETPITDTSRLETLPGVCEIVRFNKPYRLVSREFRKSDTVIQVGNVKIGGPEIVVMAGPCTIENHKQLFDTAYAVAGEGAHIIRGGAFKPRTSPYSFQGMGEQGLRYLAEVRETFGLPVITEVLDTQDVELVAEYADILQIGARNMQNYALLKKVGKTNRPVMLKRGLSATVADLFQAAEYIMAGGNHNVILCERGIRTFDNHSRFTLDLGVIPVLKEQTHLPVIVDPSHAAGYYQRVAPMARAAIAAGADGLIVEVHPNPEVALCDGSQSLMPQRFAELMQQVRQVAAAVGRSVHEDVADLEPAY